MAQQIPFSFLGDASPLPFVQFDDPNLERQDVEGLNVEFFATVASEGASSVTERGFVWSLTDGPTIADNKVISGSGLGSYSAIITFPTLDTEFFIRPYATNTEGTSYGTFEAVSWTTSYDPMIFTVQSTIPNETIAFASNESLSLNLSMNMWINWGDGSPIENIVTTTNDIHTIDHLYVSAGNHDIEISGTMSRLKLNSTNLVEFKQWGTQPFGILRKGFHLCDFVYSATDTPVFDKSRLNQNVSGYSQGMGLSQMFFQTGPLFTGNSSFNSWDVSGIYFLGEIFETSAGFNADISNWVLDGTGGDCLLAYMLSNATAFNQNLDSWDVSNATSGIYLFNNVDLTASTLSNWDWANAFSFGNIFGNTSHIPSGIGSWTFSTTNIYSLSNMFRDSTGTIPDITGWDLSNCYSIGSMFYNTSFNQNISVWDVSSVRDFSYAFEGTPFDQDISIWDVSTANSFNGMFENTPFNQDISGWDISALNYPFPSKFVRIADMFKNNTAFNQDISSWDISNLYSASRFMENVTTFSTVNYDALLISWESQLPTNHGIAITIDFGTSQYTLGGAAEAARTSLINTYSWTISDGGGI